MGQREKTDSAISSSYHTQTEGEMLATPISDVSDLEICFKSMAAGPSKQVPLYSNVFILILTFI